MIKNKIATLLAEELKSITEVSEYTGISRNALTNLYYRRTKGINFDTIDKLCNYFNCGIEDIIEFIPDEKIREGGRYARNYKEKI